jgi:hypothetical protein
MVRGFAEQSGGRLVLKSRKGKGTTAELWLPVAPKSPVAAVTEDKPSSPVSSRPLTVLVVDDDSLVLTNMAAMLEDIGHRVFEAVSAQKALSILRRERDIDLVITDQAMPRMTGSELIANQSTRNGRTYRQSWQPGMPNCHRKPIHCSPGLPSPSANMNSFELSSGRWLSHANAAYSTSARADSKPTPRQKIRQSRAKSSRLDPRRCSLDGQESWDRQPAAAWRTGYQVACRSNDPLGGGHRRGDCSSLRTR